MNVKIEDLMSKRVIVTHPHRAISHVKEVMAKNRIKAIPVVSPENQPLGIVTSSDLIKPGFGENSPVSQVMSVKVKVIPRYSSAMEAATLMRKNKIHHLVVTHEKEVVGIISSFDLLQLVEGKQFKNSNAATTGSKGKKEETATH